MLFGGTQGPCGALGSAATLGWGLLRKGCRCRCEVVTPNLNKWHWKRKCVDVTPHCLKWLHISKPQSLAVNSHVQMALVPHKNYSITICHEYQCQRFWRTKGPHVFEIWGYTTLNYVHSTRVFCLFIGNRYTKVRNMATFCTCVYWPRNIDVFLCYCLSSNQGTWLKAD